MMFGFGGGWTHWVPLLNLLDFRKIRESALVQIVCGFKNPWKNEHDVGYNEFPTLLSDSSR